MIVFLFINQAILLLGQCTRLGTWKGMPLKGWRKSDPLGYDESTVDRLIPGYGGPDTGTLTRPKPWTLTLTLTTKPTNQPASQTGNKDGR